MYTIIKILLIIFFNLLWLVFANILEVIFLVCLIDCDIILLVFIVCILLWKMIILKAMILIFFVLDYTYFMNIRNTLFHYFILSIKEIWNWIFVKFILSLFASRFFNIFGGLIIFFFAGLLYYSRELSLWSLFLLSLITLSVLIHLLNFLFKSFFINIRNDKNYILWDQKTNINSISTVIIRFNK